MNAVEFLEREVEGLEDGIVLAGDRPVSAAVLVPKLQVELEVVKSLLRKARRQAYDDSQERCVFCDQGIEHGNCSST